MAEAQAAQTRQVDPTHDPLFLSHLSSWRLDPSWTIGTDRIQCHVVGVRCWTELNLCDIVKKRIALSLPLYAVQPLEWNLSSAKNSPFKRFDKV